jgi:hypothetical protein
MEHFVRVCGERGGVRIRAPPLCSVHAVKHILTKKLIPTLRAPSPGTISSRQATFVRFRLCMSMEWMIERRLAVFCTRCLRHAYLQCA